MTSAYKHLHLIGIVYFNPPKRSTCRPEAAKWSWTNLYHTPGGQYIQPLPVWKSREQECFTVCALCYSSNNTLCIICAVVTEYVEVGILGSDHQ